MLRLAALTSAAPIAAVLGAFAAQSPSRSRASDSRPRRRGQALVKANELRTALLAAVSHDLRTPLASIKASVSSLLPRTSLDPEEQRRAPRRHRRRRRSAQPPRREPARHEPAADRHAPLARRPSARRGRARPSPASARPARRRRRGARDAPAPLVDPGLLERAIANVVDNASSGRHEGAGRGRAGDVARTRRAAGRRPRSGHPAGRTRATCSEPFQRLGDGPTAAGSAWAGGRPRVRRAMGGEIVVDDTPGGGVTMVLSLAGRPRHDPRPGRRRRTALLRALGHQPPRAWLRGGRRRRPARKRCAAAGHRPDVVVLDLGLPGIDGIEVIGGLRGWTHGAHHRAVGARRRGATRCARSTRVPTTTSPSPSAWTNCWPDSAPRSGARRPRTRSRSSRPTDFTVDLAAKRCTPTASRCASRRPSGISSRCSSATAASWCRSGSCSRRSGARSTRRDRLPACVHRPGAAQARARTRPAALLHHRAGHGLPLRARRGLTARGSTSQVPHRVLCRRPGGGGSSCAWDDQTRPTPRRPPRPRPGLRPRHPAARRSALARGRSPPRAEAARRRRRRGRARRRAALTAEARRGPPRRTRPPPRRARRPRRRPRAVNRWTPSPRRPAGRTPATGPTAQRPRRGRHRPPGHPIELRRRLRHRRGRPADDRAPGGHGRQRRTARGAAVYLWHCTREGGYSLYSDGVADQNFLRGVQVADADGNLSFTSIYPGAYNPRWPHIHFEVFEDVDTATPAAARS